MKNTFALKLLSLALALTMLSSCFVFLPASAIDIEEEPLPDFLWELDFNKMSSIDDNMGNSQYTIESKNLTLGEAHGKKALGITDNNGTYFINDVGNILDDYDTFP